MKGSSNWSDVFRRDIYLQYFSMRMFDRCQALQTFQDVSSIDSEGYVLRRHSIFVTKPWGIAMLWLEHGALGAYVIASCHYLFWRHNCEVETLRRMPTSQTRLHFALSSIKHVRLEPNSPRSQREATGVWGKGCKARWRCAREAGSRRVLFWVLQERRSIFRRKEEFLPRWCNVYLGIYMTHTRIAEHEAC